MLLLVAANKIKLLGNKIIWTDLLAGNPGSNPLYFDMNIWFSACKVTGNFEKRASASCVRKKKISGRP